MFGHFGATHTRGNSLTIKFLLMLLIVLLLFGASRLPSLARSFGQSISEFKKGIKELEDQTDDKSNRQS